MIAPHTSCRYAVVYAEAFEPGSLGYVIAAVHGIAGEDHPITLLVSRVSLTQAPLSFSPPTWVLASKVLALGANYKDASALRSHLNEEDRRVENDRRVDAQRDEYNRDEAIR